MSKFRVNEKVVSVESGETGIVRVRDVQHEGNKTVVKYMVDFGGGLEKWKIMDKSELKKVQPIANNNPFYCFEYVYNHDNNQRLIMVASVEPKSYLVENPNPDDLMNNFYLRKGRKLTIGFSIYNGKDDYDKNIGVKYAKHRMKSHPFCSMESAFSGEFQPKTVHAIIDAKADYIMEHWNEFYRPRN